MDGYHIALFVHLCALIGAVAASAIVHIALHRRMRAPTVHEFLDWHNILMAAAKAFPIALVTLVLSGSYMISAGALHAWATGFVVAGLVGFVLLLSIGMTLGAKGRALKARLDQLVSQGGGNNAPQLTPDPVAATLQRLPNGIVLAVVFDMTTKPSVAAALGIIALGIVLAAAPALLRRAQPTPAAEAAD